MTPLSEILRKLEKALVVSSQASEGEPLCAPEHLFALAQSAINGGAKGMRLEGSENIAYARARTSLPIIGLIKSASIKDKDRLNSVYITASFAEAKECAEAGADIIALDATDRPRSDGLNLAQTIQRIHAELKKPVWADIATLEEGLAAAKAGADVVSTTLWGYTKETKQAEESGPNLALLKNLASAIKVPVVLEGRVWEPAQVAWAIKEGGAFAVVVGSAITRPQLITKRFINAMTVQS